MNRQLNKIQLLAVMLIWLFVGAVSIANAQQKLKIAKITFTGTKTFSPKSLKELLKSKEKKHFNARFANIDRILLTNYYQLNGFLNVYVDYKVNKDGNKIFLEFQINEGQRFYLKEKRFVGNELIADVHLARLIELNEGDYYQQQKVDEGINRIETLYNNRGKPYVEIKVDRSVESDSLIVLTCNINEGVTVHIADIVYEFEGEQRSKRFILRREMAFQVGDIFSREKIEKSQKNIYSTGLFQFVNYRLEPLPDDPSRVVVRWQLSEKKTAWIGFRFGVGNEQDDAKGNITTFDFTAEGGHRSIAGTARSFSLQIVPSFHYGRATPNSPRKFRNPRNQYTVSFVEPWMFETRTPGVLKISWTDEKPPITTLPAKTLLASFNISHEFDNFWSYSAGISYQQVEIEKNTDISQVSLQELNNLIAGGQDLIYAVTVVPVKDRRDNLFTPRRGYLTEFFNKIAYTRSRPILAGEAQDTLVTNMFYKFNFQWSRYQKFALKKSWTFATRLRTAGIVEFGTRRSIEFIPQTERFYLGGANTVRGYEERFIGEILTYQKQDGSIEQEPLGGKYLVLCNAELRIPLFWLFEGEVFLDAGNIFQEVEDMKNFSLKVSSGIGLAIITPFGPLRFDYGWKWFRKTGESAGNFHIGISFAF